MKSKFGPDIDSGVQPPPAARLIDPEAYDASEQRFAASVEEKPAPPRFVVDAVPEPSINLEERTSSGGDARVSNRDFDQPLLTTAPEEGSRLDTQGKPETVTPDASLEAELLRPPDADSWRGEVAARVNNYRARRRPREPRYPSLQLKFDPPQSVSAAQPATRYPATPNPSSRLAVAMQETFCDPQQAQTISLGIDGTPDRSDVAEGGAKIIEFPRSTSTPAPVLDELAEPVMDRPRIVEVPDVLLPPPALGGILMEAAEELGQERRPGFELPLQAALMSRRLLAGVIDSLLVISAFAVFAYIFFRVTSIVPALLEAAGASVSLMALFWAAYQYLLLVYTGTTPGLKLARLQLSRFDGTAVPRKLRRWRVLASLLSGLSLALGYAWCFMDEDQLSWHDRITRTYLAPQPSKLESPVSA